MPPVAITPSMTCPDSDGGDAEVGKGSNSKYGHRDTETLGAATYLATWPGSIDEGDVASPAFATIKLT